MKWLKKSIAFLTILLLSAIGSRTQSLIDRSSAEFTGISGMVTDANTKLPLPARVEIYNDKGELQSSYYKSLPGIFTGEDGSFRMELSPGKYKMKIFHGFDYLSQIRTITITKDKTSKLNVELTPWISLKKMGWINGEAHAHLYTEKKPDSAMLAGVRKICRAQGIDFICAAQGWAGATDASWRDDYHFVSDSNFLMYYGAEMPKYRTGHYWWLGLESTQGNFENLLDTAYETRYYQSPDAIHWTFDSLGFQNFPDFEFVPRMEKSQQAVAVVAHPTRWWMQEREKSVKYTTNAIASLSFNLLAANPPGGLVVMGDVKDHYSYQNLWFHVLNLGYRVPAFSELDGGYLPEFKYPYGLMRTYYNVDSSGRDIMDDIVNAAKKGRTFVTTGPVILAKINGRSAYGDVFEPDGKEHKLSIEVFASGDIEDKLSYLIIFRNGRIWKQWDLRKEGIRHFKQELSISEKDPAWYVLKAYGKKAWKDSSNLEVLGWFDKSHPAESADRDVCITSPFYFRTKGDEDPKPLISQIKLKLAGTSSKADGIAEIFLEGEKMGFVDIHDGYAEFSMPVNAVLKISVPGLPVVYRNLFTDYPPTLKLIEPLANGDWQKDPAFSGKVFSGYIPWPVYRFEETRQLLRQVEWEINLAQTMRDRNWAYFETLFQP